jgi:glycosyltransferase involved in cell wall biosynthesis
VRVAVISTTIFPVPLSHYGGLEALAYLQAKGLAERGHQVLLVAPVGSKPPPGVELHGTTLMEPEKQAYSGYWQRLLEYDAVIDNSWQKWSYMLKMEGRLKAPVLGVLHAVCSGMYQKPPPVDRPRFVCISNDQAAHALECWGLKCRVAYNGIDLDFYKPDPFAPKAHRYLFLARITRLKGPHIAIDACLKTNATLDLIGDDRIVEDQSYVARIKELCKAPQIVYHGGIPREKTVRFYRQDWALLHPNQLFREPFGLAPVEAMACGCPVIAWDHGAMRETVKHGETGFLVTSQAEIEELIKTDAVKTIKPERCREWASQFSYKAMIDRYEALCKEAIESGGW